MQFSRRAGMALLAMMAFAAVAHADGFHSGPYPENHVESKHGKVITIIPKGKLYASSPKGKPEPFIKKAAFVLNNTIIHKAKATFKAPKVKEEPIKDTTVKAFDLKWKPETEFIKNNTIIHKAKAIFKAPKVKEEPIKDTTVKAFDLKWKPETEFIKNNTIIHKAKAHDNLPKVKEAPIKDITHKHDDMYKGIKQEAKDIYDHMVDKAHHEYYNNKGYGYRRMNRKQL